MKKNKKKLVNKFISIAIVVLTIIGITAIIGHFINNKADEDGRIEIYPTYGIGSLDTTGKYVETNESIYTKEAFKCDGLKITPIFESNISYQIFFYDELGTFVSSTSILDNYYTDNIPSGSSYARIVITPKWDKSIKEDEKNINIFQINKYSKQLTIKVYKEQYTSYEKYQKTLESYTEIELSVLGKGIYDMNSKSFSTNDKSNWYFYDVIDISKSKSIVMKVPKELLTAKVTYNSSSMDALVFYDLTNNKTIFSEKLITNDIYSVDYEDNSYTYFKLNVSSIDECCFAVNEESIEQVKVWLF